MGTLNDRIQVCTSRCFEFAQPLKDRIHCLLSRGSDNLLEAYNWNLALYLAMYEQKEAYLDDLKNGRIEIYKFIEGVFSWCLHWSYIITYNPVLLVDPVLDNLIKDTKPTIETFRVPYNAFFINKVFPVADGYVMGVYVYDDLELDIQMLRHDRQFAKMREAIKFRDEVMDDPSRCLNDHIKIAYIFVQDDFLTFGYNSVDVILDPSLSLTEVSDELLGDRLKMIEKTVLNYAINLSNLIVLNVDLKNPKNPARDLQIRSGPPKNSQIGKIKHIKNMSTIHVQGITRQYAEQYNETLKRRNGSLDATHVRGHYRTFRSERYTHKKNMTVWIPPYIRGMDREIFNKLIRITN